MQKDRTLAEEEKRDERGDKDCEISKEDEKEGKLYPEKLDLTGCL